MNREGDHTQHAEGEKSAEVMFPLVVRRRNSMDSEKQPWHTEQPNEQIEPLSCDRMFQEIGEFGLYQILVALTTGAALCITGFTAFNFIYASNVPPHRCWIPQCENHRPNNFTVDWLKFAVPHNNDQPSSCWRYQFVGPESGPNEGMHSACDQTNFNRSHVIPCDSFVIKNNEDRLLSRLGMLCTGQEDKLALIGTLSTIGRLVGMPVAGVISDRLGRLHTIVVGSVIGAVFGCLQALPASMMTFELYLVLELFTAFCTAGVLGACYVFNSEWVSAGYRVHLNSISSILNALHVVGIGLAGWYYEDSFYEYKMALAVPGFFMLASYVAVRESPQWLLAKNKHGQAINSIVTAGKINGRPPSDKVIEQIQGESLHFMNKRLLDELRADSLYKSTVGATGPTTEASPEKDSDEVTMRNVLARKSLALRLFVMSLVWFFSVYAYYGIAIASRNVHDNKYISFVIIGLAEIPGTLLCTVLMNRFGRRMTIGANLLVCGAMLILTTQTTAQSYLMVMYFIGRSTIKTAVLGLSTYTTELWPTATRNTLFSISGLCGRLGGIFASLAVLLDKYFVYLPAILNGSVTIAASILLFAFLPETLNCGKLPDTVDEASAIGKRVKKRPKSTVSEKLTHFDIES